jgi:hypothetical protein
MPQGARAVRLRRHSSPKVLLRCRQKCSSSPYPTLYGLFADRSRKEVGGSTTEYRLMQPLSRNVSANTTANRVAITFISQILVTNIRAKPYPILPLAILDHKGDF